MLLALSLSACRPAGLTGAEGSLQLSPTTLDFADTWLGATAKQPLVLTNTGRSAMQLTFEAPAPFVAPDAVRLEGGSSLTVEPGFQPSALGAAAGTLTVREGELQQSVALKGTGVAPPPCDESACRTATLDPDTSTCVQTARPDGTACGQACLTGGVCVHGDCVGAAISCDDGDTCTTDACEPQTGCVHTPVECASADPCAAPACEPGAGCTTHPSPDGTGCGTADCTTAHVCIGGQCVVRAVPEGAGCASQTLCQPAGHCQAQQCVRQAPTQLAREWMYQAPAGRQLAGLVGDEENHLFTSECHSLGAASSFSGQCEVVSFDAAGAERWRTPHTHPVNLGGGALRDSLMLAGSLLVSTVAPDWVDALDASTGRNVWAVDLKTLGLFSAGSSPLVRVLSVGFDGHQLVLALEGSNGGAVSGDAVVALDPATGALLHTVHLPAQGFSLVIDRQGQTYVSHVSGPLTAQLDTVTALDPAFQVRWQKGLPVIGDSIRLMLATRAGQVVLTHPSHSELLSTRTGGVAASWPTSYWFTGQPVWSSQAMFIEHQYCPPGASCQSYHEFTVDLDALNLTTQQASPNRLTPLSWVAPSWLTDKGTALLSMRAGVAGSLPVLREVDAHGATVMECPLQLTGVQVVAGPVLGNGHYAALIGEPGYTGNERLEVWPLPGYAPASTGWVSPRGGRRLDQREQ